MPSTRKQIAKERRSRQLDIMSDVENVDIMLGSYDRDDERAEQSESELNLDSGSNRLHQNPNLVGEDFRSLLNTNSRENSEVTVETTRLINEEISNQMSRRLNEIKSSLNSQIQNAISAAIADTVLPSIQNTLETQGRTNFTIMDRGSNELHPSSKAGDFTKEDRRSNGLQWNSGAEKPLRTWENRPKMCYTHESNRLRSRESSVESSAHEQNRDRRGIKISALTVGLTEKIPYKNGMKQCYFVGFVILNQKWVTKKKSRHLGKILNSR